MSERVAITTPANPHALGTYLAAVLVGGSYILGGETPRALTDRMGQGAVSGILLGMVLSGSAGIVAVLLAGRMLDPTSALLGEVASVLGVVLTTGAYLVSLLGAYDFSGIRATACYAIALLVGCVGRLALAALEIRRISRARRLAQGDAGRAG